MNYRLSAWEREAHDRAECPELCRACALIEAREPVEDPCGRDLLVTLDFEERY